MNQSARLGPGAEGSLCLSVKTKGRGCTAARGSCWGCLVWVPCSDLAVPLAQSGVCLSVLVHPGKNIVFSLAAPSLLWEHVPSARGAQEKPVLPQRQGRPNFALYRSHFSQWRGQKWPAPVALTRAGKKTGTEGEKSHIQGKGSSESKTKISSM